MSYRDLWAAVVLQACDDLDGADQTSLVYDHAAAFFFAKGQWATARRSIGDFLDLHADDIERVGRKIVEQRATREAGAGLAPITPPLIVFQPADPPYRPPVAAKPVDKRTLKKNRKPATRDRLFWIRAFLAKNAA